MTTTDGAPEVWRVECEGGEAREVPVRARAVLLGGRVQTLYEAGAGDASVERLTARAAAVGLASFEGWPVVAVLAPGEPARAEVAAELAATEAEARRALDEMHRRVEAAEAESERLTECLRRANASLEETERTLYLEAQAAEAELDALRAAVQRHREAVEREQDEATTRAELFALVPPALTVREPATQADDVHAIGWASQGDIEFRCDGEVSQVPRCPDPAAKVWRADNGRLFAHEDEAVTCVRCHQKAARERREEAERVVAKHAARQAAGLPFTTPRTQRDAALACLAAERAYHATEGRPWAERIAAKRRADEARAVLARMMGGG